DELGVADEEDRREPGHVQVLQVPAVPENEVENPQRGAVVAEGGPRRRREWETFDGQGSRERVAPPELAGESFEPGENAHRPRVPCPVDPFPCSPQRSATLPDPVG